MEGCLVVASLPLELDFQKLQYHTFLSPGMTAVSEITALWSKVTLNSDSGLNVRKTIALLLGTVWHEFNLHGRL